MHSELQKAEDNFLVILTTEQEAEKVRLGKANDPLTQKGASMHSQTIRQWQRVESMQDPESRTSNAVDYPAADVLQKEMRTYMRTVREAPIIILPLQHKRLPPRRYPVNRRKDAWTPAEDAIVKAVYPTGGIQGTQQALVAAGFRERSTRSLYARAHGFKLRTQVGSKFNPRLHREDVTCTR